jgi:hypothetical protein
MDLDKEFNIFLSNGELSWKEVEKFSAEEVLLIHKMTRLENEKEQLAFISSLYFKMRAYSSFREFIENINAKSMVKNKVGRISSYDEVVAKYENLFELISNNLDKSLLNIHFHLKIGFSEIEKIKLQNFDTKYVEKATEKDIYGPFLKVLVEKFMEARELKESVIEKKKQFNDYVLDCSELAYLILDHLGCTSLKMSSDKDRPNFERPIKRDKWGTLPIRIKEIIKTR